MENTIANPHLFWKEVEKRNVTEHTTPPLEKRPSKPKINANIEKIITSNIVPTITPIIKATTPSPVLVANASVNGAFDFWRKVAAVSKHDDKEVSMDSKPKSRPYSIVKKHPFELDKDTLSHSKGRSLAFITDTYKSAPTVLAKRKKVGDSDPIETYDSDLGNTDTTSEHLEEAQEPHVVDKVAVPSLGTSQRHDFQQGDAMSIDTTFSPHDNRPWLVDDLSEPQTTPISQEDNNARSEDREVVMDDAGVEIIRVPVQEGLKLYEEPEQHNIAFEGTTSKSEYEADNMELRGDASADTQSYGKDEEAHSKEEVYGKDEACDKGEEVHEKEEETYDKEMYGKGDDKNEDKGEDVDKDEDKDEDVDKDEEYGKGEDTDGKDEDVHMPDSDASQESIDSRVPDMPPKEAVTKVMRHTPLIEGTLSSVGSQEDLLETKKKRGGKLKIFSHKQRDREKEDKEGKDGKEKLKLNLSIFKHKRSPSDTTSGKHSPRDGDSGQKGVSLSSGAKRPVFGADLQDLVPHADVPGVPLFVVSAVQILANSESVDVDYLFSDSHSDPKIHVLRQQIDQGLDISQVHETRMVAGLLKLFFLNLPVPLLGNLYKNFAEIQDVDNNSLYLSMLQSILWLLPPLHMVLLQFFVKFLRENYVVDIQGDSMEYVMNKLGAAFGPAFMRNVDGKQSIVQNEICRSIITHYDMLFLHRNAQDMKLVVRNNMLILEMASTDRIIERMLDANYNESDFARMFLTTHAIVLSSSTLVDKLAALYTGSSTNGRSESIRKWKVMRNQRILDVLRLWLDTPTWENVREDKSLVAKLCREFIAVEQWMSKGSPHHKPSPKSTLLNHFGMAAAPRSRSVAYSGHNNANFSLLDTAAVDIAHHCTQIDHDLFLSIRSIEWVKFSEGPHALDGKSLPHLSAFQRQSIQWSYWIGEIVKEGHLGRRVLLLSHFINIAQVCYELGNFNCAYSIAVGLAHPSVRRLETTWQLLPKNSVDQFTQLLERHSYEMAKSIADMFRLLKQMKAPCVPYFGTVQKLFANMDESNPIHPREYPQLVDLDRLRTVYGIVEIFLKYDKVYSVKIVPRIYIYLQEMTVLTPEQLLANSLKCEEPAGTHPTPTQPITNSPQEKDREVTKTYKVPVVANHWTTEVQRIWAKPFEQLPIGIDLPRLATLISVGSCPSHDLRRYTITPVETTAHLPISAANVDGPDTRARDILDMLFNLTKFLESDAYASNLREQFCKYVVLDGAKDRDMSREIAHLFEYLGKECRVAKVLKAINQAIIAPPIIELTLNVCSKLPFRDAGGWRIYVHKHATTDQVMVTHIKRQKARSHTKEEEFEFEWRLEMVLDGDDLHTMSLVVMRITDIGYGEALTQNKKAEVDRMLGPYTLP